MCLAVPMRLIEIGSGNDGSAEIEGVTYSVNLSFIEEPKVGEYVIVHAGFAIEKLDEVEANKRIELFKSIAALGESTDS